MGLASCMSEPFNLIKMLSGPFTGVFWAKVTMYLLASGFIIFIGIGVWRGYFKKAEPTTDQDAQLIENHYNQPRSTFGCAFSRTYIKRVGNEI